MAAVSSAPNSKVLSLSVRDHKQSPDRFRPCWASSVRCSLSLYAQQARDPRLGIPGSLGVTLSKIQNSDGWEAELINATGNTSGQPSNHRFSACMCDYFQSETICKLGPMPPMAAIGSKLPKSHSFSTRSQASPRPVSALLGLLSKVQLESLRTASPGPTSGHTRVTRGDF